MSTDKEINDQDLFIIDKSTGCDLTLRTISHEEADEDVPAKDDDDDDDGDDDDDQDTVETPAKKHSVNSNKMKLASALDPGIGSFGTYFNMSALGKKYKPTKGKESKHAEKDKEIMKKSAITPDFEKNSTIPAYEESLRQSKKHRKLEQEKTKGKGWYKLPLLDPNSERKNDLLVLQMRKALNPKQFYKGMDHKALPKYCQFGRIVEDPADFYSSRVPKKQRKKTLVDELLADAEFRKFNKRKYSEIQESKRKATGPYKHMKRLKKKKKLH
ncbi:hypothetical protein ScPMuIL_009842 [Solemya velum]